MDMRNYVTHLECSASGERYEAGQPHNLSRIGKPLLVRYDLEAMRGELDRRQLDGRAAELWRYREFLPLRRAENIVRLGEVMTPVIRSPWLERAAGVREVAIKDEGRLPTGSFKARGLALAVSMARELGIARMAMPTNGNAGAALAAYCARAGIECYAFCPQDTPEVNVREMRMQGAKVWRANGLIDECARIVREGAGPMGWFDVSTLKEPYRIEGKKTMGLELAEQYGWELPDVILYPTGGGTGLIGMWKAFAELEAVGWLGARRPRMVAVQAAGCAPIVQAFEQGAEHAEPWPDARTLAAGIRVPAAIGDFLILRALRESGGFAVAVTDEEIVDVQARIAAADGLLLCPEGAATAAALVRAVESGLVQAGERCLLFNCASGLKYPMPAAEGFIDLAEPLDFARLQAGREMD